MYPHSMLHVCAKIRKIKKSIKCFNFYNLKYLCIMHGRFFVMQMSNYLMRSRLSLHPDKMLTKQLLNEFSRDISLYIHQMSEIFIAYTNG